ncbi:hypothetical protein B296_00037612 [Ensete ventricosum]|uniref:MIR domain-containing protein n=1 Tax=Ensete ventricosum TaxID=4639 RepID=A0A426Z7S2_ENSVE|nr:hypothetical protein B296_00037612 [Ensete ventricosum]
MVSSFTREGEFNTGDLWRFEMERSGKTCTQDQRVRLHHVDTGGYQHRHDKRYMRKWTTQIFVSKCLTSKKKKKQHHKKNLVDELVHKILVVILSLSNLIVFS